ncbi:DUF3592 domain-containing protein [Streptomyces sp. NPDC059897]|uniref:DUF3592 domain-containing protein n=1 Tax=Streptomyces sp. NPDC059897 TaxID=3346994 RepID=UPI003648546B
MAVAETAEARNHTLSTWRPSPEIDSRHHRAAYSREKDTTMWIAMSLLAGLTVLGFGVREVVVQYRIQREGIRAGGRVVRHARGDAGRHGGPVYFAVVEFVDTYGGRHTFEAGSSGVKGLPVGGGVPVRYLPDAPKSARIDLTGRRVGEVTALFGVGALFTAIGIFLLVTGR